MALTPPPRSFDRSSPLVTVVKAAELIRISRFTTSEPYFGRAAANRFDDHRSASKRFGTCYCGLTLNVAFAETVLHDAAPVAGRFPVPLDALESRHVVQFSGMDLVLMDLSGVALKRSGIDSSISTIEDYALPQRWAVAVHRHKLNVDGIVYMSRHINTEKAVVLFDRAKAKLTAVQYTPLPDYPGALRAVLALGVTPK